jgi:hypothetical protein
MKTYKLKAWPELPPAFRRMACRRLLSELSQRHVSEPELRSSCGLSSGDVRALLSHLDQEGLLDTREAPDTAPSSRGWMRFTAPLQQLLLRRAN